MTIQLTAADRQRLVAISNRLPVVMTKTAEGWKVNPGSGGLVSAMAPVLRDRGGLWIGWSGTDRTGWEQLLPDTERTSGYKLIPVRLTRDEVNGFYSGFSNQVLWPLFHDLQTRCNFDITFWKTYLTVNRKFAQAALEQARDSDFIWVHDYQLIHVAESLRTMRAKNKIGFFLHIPFPSADILAKLPWRRQVLRALLAYDLVGFQTPMDRRHFISSLRQFIGGIKVKGRGAVLEIEVEGVTRRVGTFPIGIDYNSFNEQSAHPDVIEQAQKLRKAIRGEKLILGIDRLDYTKGLIERLLSFNRALEKFPDLQGRATLVQVVVPSRTDVPQYRDLKSELEQLVSQINGRFTRNGWVPILHMFRSLDRKSLLAHYRAADVMLVASLKDGMNLVAKEFCACRQNRGGTLILSEFAGASAQLGRHALLINPYDYDGCAEVIHQAVNFSDTEQRRRMRAMRAIIRRSSIFWWVDAFLNTALSKTLMDFPFELEYLA